MAFKVPEQYRQRKFATTSKGSLHDRLLRGAIIDVNNCLIWTGSLTHNGYGQIGRGEKKQGIVRTHRAMWEIYNGKIPQGMIVMHICDNRACMNISHLKLGTHLDNARDMIEKSRGRHPRGDENHSKLTEEDVRKIRKLYAEKKETTWSLAKIYPVHRTTILRIVQRKKWAWLN